MERDRDGEVWTVQEFGVGPTNRPLYALQRHSDDGVEYQATGYREEIDRIVADHRLKPMELPASTEKEFVDRARGRMPGGMEPGSGELAELIAQRDSMREVLSRFEHGDRDRSKLPTDAHLYYGRLTALEQQIEAAATQEIGRKNMPEQTLENGQDPSDLPGRMRQEVSELLTSRRADLEREAAETVAFSAVEAGAALNYLRGRFEEFNATREAFARQRPDLEKDLPPSLQVDEIQVRQHTIEQERSEEKGLAVAR